MAQLKGRFGVILLAVWLIIGGAAVIVHLSFDAFPILMAILAIIAGILLLIGA